MRKSLDSGPISPVSRRSSHAGPCAKVREAEGVQDGVWLAVAVCVRV